MVSFTYLWIFKDLPSPNHLTTPPKQTTQIFDRNSNLLYEIYDQENRTLVELNNIPIIVRQATIAVEDQDFYQHQGFSLRGIFRAIERNITTHQKQGGSTITQQLIKNTLLTSEKSIARKIKEIILAIHAELIFSKDEILQMYLNQVAYGGTAYGIQAASQQYFGKNVADLNLAEAALLAGLPQAPTRYSPFGENSYFAKQRQEVVLGRMVEDGYITKEQADDASNQQLVFISPSTSILAPHFVMYVKDQLVNHFGETLVNQGGLKVYTTLDLKLQEITQNIIREEIARLKPLHVTNGSALITNPQTGEILTMVGSIDYFDIKNGGQVNLTTALRQPGSAIKPINYALAFEKGYSPSSIIEDTPITFSIPGSPPWSPKNYDGRFHGTVTLRQSLGSSYNIPAVKLLAANGISQMITLGQKMGITTWNDPSRFGLSLTLGGGEVKMTDLAQVYGTFANLGQTQGLKSILSVVDSNNQPLLFPSAPLPQQVISSQTAYLITDILADNQARAPAFGTNSALNIKSAQVAVKTGTSNDLRDNWTIGYTPNYLVAVWVGNNDNSPMSNVASGITGASPIWSKTISQILAKDSSVAFSQPTGMIKVAICGLTNTLACPNCPNIRTEIYVQGKQPTTTCNEQLIQQALQKKSQPTTDSNGQILTGISTSR